MKKRSLYLMLFLLFLFPGLFSLLAVGVVGATYTTFQDAPLALTTFSVCTAAFLAPGVVFALLWRKEAKREDLLQQVGAILRGYRELRIADLAAKLGKTPAEAEALAAQSVGAGHAQGWIDHASSTFYSGAVVQVPGPPVPQVIVVPQAPPAAAGEVRYCRECGTRVNRIAGTASWQCPACGNVQ